MRPQRWWRGCAGVLAAAALAMTGCVPVAGDKAGGAAHSQLILTLANVENEPSAAVPFAQAVKALSSGAIEIDIKTNWRAGAPQYEGDLIKDVEAGTADLGISATRAFDSVGIDSFKALEAPFLIDTYALEQQVLASSIPDAMLAGLEPGGVVGLVVLPGALRRPLGRSHALVTLTDFRGVTIGIRPSDVADETFAALGATPVAFVPAGSTSALDGIEASVEGVELNHYDEGAAALTANVNFWPRTSTLFINAKVLSGMTEGQRGWLRQASSKAKEGALAAVLHAEAGESQLLCRRHLRFAIASPVELAELRQAVDPVYLALKKDAGTKAFIEQIEETKAAMDLPAEVAPPCSPADSSPSLMLSSGAPSPVDGTWEVSFTRPDLLAASPGISAGEDNPGNYGHFLLDLHAGRFRVTGPGPSEVTHGTFMVEDGSITFYVSNGETQTYPWSIYRDTLTFGGDGPTPMRVKPWRRVGG